MGLIKINYEGMFYIDVKKLKSKVNKTKEVGRWIEEI